MTPLRWTPCGESDSRRSALAAAVWTAAAFAAALSQQHAPGGADLAYIGPGAGFAFLGSFLAILASLVLSALSLLVWPFRMLWRTVRLR
ncbi:MAG TPA: hypothetical protein VIC04_06960, partial [Terriglobia bacterium]